MPSNRKVSAFRPTPPGMPLHECDRIGFERSRHKELETPIFTSESQNEVNFVPDPGVLTQDDYSVMSPHATRRCPHSGYSSRVLTSETEEVVRRIHFDSPLNAAGNIVETPSSVNNIAASTSTVANTALNHDVNIKDDTDDSSYSNVSSNSLCSDDQSSADDIPSSQDIVQDSEVADIMRQQGHDLLKQCMAYNSNYAETQLVVAQDFWSSVFNDELDGVIGSNEPHVTEEIPQDNPGNTISEGSLERAVHDRIGGLQGWSYSSPFGELVISIDSADKALGERFVKEANTMLRNVVMDVQGNSDRGHTVTATNLSRLDLLDAFLPQSILEKLRINVNRVLRARKQDRASTCELKAVVVLHVLVASYHSSVQTITNRRNMEFFYQIGLSGERYSQIWSALFCITESRGRVESFASGRSNKPTRGNSLITELEQELAAVNRVLLYVPGVTVFSLDDDHQRLRSRAVADMTNLSQINNPQKALGPVNNALCSALTAVNLANHYSRTGEKIDHAWERLVQLVQGVPTVGSLKPMTDAIFAADRGYNTKGTIDFLNNRLGATGIGTHKRSLDYPFVFGDGAIRTKHKGMIVSEKGSPTIYSAARKRNGGAGRKVEAVVYPESFSGRIAAMYHNESHQFGADKFILIPKTPFRGTMSIEQVEDLQVLYDKSADQYALRRYIEGGSSRRPRGRMSLPAVKVLQVLSAVRQFTLLQSEDPGWFLARAFQFTSRTTHGFYVQSLSTLVAE